MQRKTRVLLQHPDRRTLRLFATLRLRHLASLLVGTCAVLIAATGCLPREGRPGLSLSETTHEDQSVAWPVEESGTVTTTLGEASGVESDRDSLRLRISIPRAREKRTLTLAVALPPERSPTAQIADCRIRQIEPWDLEAPDERVTSGVLARQKTGLAPQVSLSHEGIARHTWIYKLTVNPELPGTWDGKRYELAEAVVEIRWNMPWQAATIDDAAYASADSPWMQMLRSLVVNPSALNAYADPRIRTEATEPALGEIDWQPAPVPGQNAPGAWLKIPVEREGLYAIDWHTLQGSGWNPDEIQPARLRLFNEGKEVPTVLVGGLAKRFTVQDRLVFWGRPTDSPVSAENMYFLGIAPEGVSPLRFEETRGLATPGTTPIDEWTLTRRIEQDHILETKEGNFLSIQDMRWVWEEIPKDKAHTLFFELPGLVQRPDNGGDKYASVRIFFYVGKGEEPPQGSVRVTLNDTVNGEAHVSGTRLDPVLVLAAPIESLREKDNELVFEWKDTKGSTPLFLDAVEVTYLRRLHVREDGLILPPSDRTSTASVSLRVSEVSPDRLLALGLGDPRHPTRLPVVAAANGSESTIPVPGGFHERIGLFDLHSVASAPSGHLSPWKPWRTLDTGADSIAIANREFLEAANDMAEIWRRDGYHPLVVDVESLYDAYTAGLQDPAAIKRFLADALLRWKEKPLTVLLIGDCSSDYSNQARNQVRNWVPTHSVESAGLAHQDRYASDLWYATLVGDDQFADVFVGRLSVASTEDARAVVEKQKRAREFPKGIWLTAAGLVADHGTFEDVCEELRLQALPSHVLTRIAYVDREPFEDNFYLPAEYLKGDEIKVSPATTRRVQDLFEQGTTILAFYGHGSPNIWSDQRIWFGGDSPNSDNRRLRNARRLPLVFNGTCNTGAIDYPVRPWNVCITEDMMRQPQGGALACFVPSAPGFTSNHKMLSEPLFRGAFDLGVRQMGPLTELARMSYLVETAADEHSRMFILLGDPLAEIPGPRAETNAVAARIVEDSAGTGKSRPLLEASSTLAQAGDSTEWHMIGPDGDPLPIADTDVVTSSPLEFRIRLPEDTKGRIQVLQAAWGPGTGGTGRVAAATAWAGPREISVKSITAVRNPGHLESSSRNRPVVMSLENLSWQEASGTAVVSNLMGNGTWGEIGRTPFELKPRESRQIVVDLSLAPGVNVLRGGILETKEIRRARSDLERTTVVVVTDESKDRDVAVVVDSVKTSEYDEKMINLMVHVIIGNIGREPWPGGEALLVRDANALARVKAGDIITTDLVASRRSLTKELLPGEFHEFTLPVARITRQHEIRWSVVWPNDNPVWKDNALENNADAVEFVPANLPDLTFVPGSLSFQPERPTEGETVFLEAIVENVGRMETGGFKIHGNWQDKSGRELRIVDRTQLRDPLEPTLFPGEQRRIRRRWDPRDNLDATRVVLQVNPTNQVTELDLTNNRIEVPIDVRSKWKLVPQGITIENRTQSSVTLVARIRNEGETAARFVEVAFYPDDQHTKENRLGEVIQDRIEPGQTVEFRYEWRLRPEDVGRRVRPSFEAYIKGSLLRVAGVGAE